MSASMEHTDVLIVGAGISGIGMGCRLKIKNPDVSFVILEGRAAIGGTWDLFRFPGIRSDSDMYTFGYDFRPWQDARAIAPGEAIVRYLEETVDAYGLRDAIRFGHRVEALAWSTADRRWTVEVRCADDGSLRKLSCRFLVTCTGYYDYTGGYQPDFPGLDDFAGRVVHPQSWPDDLDHDGQRILVVGSGATAVTLVPALAETAGHVTMLQRSPSYVFNRPAIDHVARWLKAWLPAGWAHRLIRTKNILLQWYGVYMARTRPGKVRQYLQEQTAEQVGNAVDVDVHFNPRYNPWEQRLCVSPDGDLFEALRRGTASVVTDSIDRFTPTGVLLQSGETIDADVVVTATGLRLQFLGGASVQVDGRTVEPHEMLSYRGLMYAGVPNWVAIIGYTAASWTLRSDLIADYVCRLLKLMKARGADMVTPVLDERPRETKPMMANIESAGYVQRGGDAMPRQGTEAPWRNYDNYLRDYFSLRWGRIDDGVLRFSARDGRSTAESRPDSEDNNAGEARAAQA